MTRKFVDYLNSMNNVDGNSTGALAESQIINKFYKKIHVNRKLGDFIKKSIQNNENKVFFITGHAGDGKTSILAQVLKELNLIDNRSLKEYDFLENDQYKVFYVKDMSELEENTQEKLIKRSLEISEEKATAIVISNTGPLIKTLKKIDANLESDVITQLDKNEYKELMVEDKKFSIINLARIDNVDFVDEILDKLIDDELWYECENCGKGKVCHITFNKKLIKNHKNRISEFIKNYYRWLYENDQRLTIRQMIAHLTFMITANKSCDYINKDISNEDYYKYIYNLANNLFGYHGIEEDENSNQIEAIKKLKNLNLDKISLDEDYKLFVKNDYTMMPKEVADIVKDRWSKYERDCNENNGLDKIFDREKAIKIRKCIRRFFLVFGLDECDDLMNQIFGETFTLYKKCITGKEEKNDLKKLKDIVFNSLRKLKFDGGDDKDKKLYLTLKRHDGIYQSVMLVIGEVDKKQLEIKSRNIKNEFDDIEYKNEIYLKRKNSESEYLLNYQLVEYFNSILQGAIETKASPMITCGIAKLDSWLIKNFKDNEQTNKLEILIKTANGIKITDLEITDLEIEVE
ncbi:hypothetical protein ACV3M6_02415 [Clostridium perfringens]